MIIAANWKMNKTSREVKEYIAQLIPLIKGVKARIYLAVPFPWISLALEAAKGSALVIGAQNMHDADHGAFTGEVSAHMLHDAGAHFVLIGHSERRHLFHENDAFVNRKVKRALSCGLQPILCIGETSVEREKGETEDVLERQLFEGLKGVAAEETKHLIVAYEPVWAIGTGKSATPQIAQEAHASVRKMLTLSFGEEIAPLIPILYGGSVKPENTHELMRERDIDGALVGGASLDPKTFSEIILKVVT